MSYKVDIHAAPKQLQEMMEKVLDTAVELSQRLQAVPAGALPAGPAGQTRYMEVTAVGTWTYGGSPVGSNAEGYRTTFWWTGDTWVDNGSVKVVGPMAAGTDTLQPESIPKGKAVEDFTKRTYIAQKDIGVQKINIGDNIIPILSNSDFDNVQEWGVGYLNNTGSVVAGAWHYTKNYYQVKTGTYPSNLYVAGAAKIILYDSNKNVVKVISDVGNPFGTVEYNIIVDVDGYIRPSKVDTHESTQNYIKSPVEIINITTEVFETPEKVDTKLLNSRNETLNQVASIFQSYGFENIPSGTNFLSELNTSPLTNTDVWGQAEYLNKNGSITAGSGWHYSKKYYRIYPGTYEYRFYFSLANPSFIIYTKSKGIFQAIANPSGTLPVVGTITIPSDNGDEYYIRTTHRSGYPIGNIFFRNTEEIVIVPSANVVGGDVAVKNMLNASAVTKSKIPVISFINDDGHKAAYDWYLPILNTKGVKSTFACVSNWTQTKPTTHFTPEELLDLIAAGHEIANHSEIHRYLMTDNTIGGALDVAEVERDIRTSKMYFDSIGIDTPMFVAPFGDRNVEVDKVIRKYHNSDFVTRADSEVLAGTICNTSPIDNYLLKRVSFDALNNTESRLQICKDAVDVALAKNEWLVIAVHSQYNEYNPTANPDNYLSRRQELADLIDYIQSLNIPILTAGKAWDIWKNSVEVGDRRLTPKSYTIGMDGTIVDNL